MSIAEAPATDETELPDVPESILDQPLPRIIIKIAERLDQLNGRGGGHHVFADPLADQFPIQRDVIH